MPNQRGEGPTNAGPSDGSSRRPKGRQLKEALIEAGLELLREQGLALTADTISYANVFAHLESSHGVRVTRASVHERIWSSHDDFRRDVLASSLPHLERPTVAGPGKLAQEAIMGVETAPAHDRIDRFSRATASTVYQRLLSSPTSVKLQAVKVVASRSNDPLAAEMLHPLLADRAAESVKEVRAGFGEAVAELRLKPRTGLGLGLTETADLYHRLITPLLIGGMLDDRSGSRPLTAPIDFGSVSKEDKHAWTPLSVGFASIMRLLLEGDDDAELDLDSIGHRPKPPPEFEVDQTLVDSRRRTREELKTLVLAAGVELFLQSSVDLRPDSLSYASVFERLKRDRGLVVNRGSVHKRIWSSHSDFRFEVLARALRNTGQQHQELARIFESTPPTTHDDGTIDRHQTATDILRSVGETQLGVAMNSIQYRQLLQVKAALVAQPDSPGANALRDAIQQADADRLARYSRQTQTSLLDLGFEIRPELGITFGEGRELFSLLAITSIAGATHDQLAGVPTGRISVDFAADSDPRPEKWMTMGLILRAYFEMLFVDPDRKGS